MIGIIDYGAGNTASVSYALERFNVPFIVTDDRKVLEDADKIIFPGVGAAEAAMRRLEKIDMVQFLQETVKPVLGICLGMQMFSSFSEEGNIACLGIVREKCLKFPESGIKVPHMGWNQVSFQSGHVLFSGIAPDAYFYFAHSYYLPVTEHSIARSANGVAFTAALQRENFYGVQFHPEKSSVSGLKVLRNFIDLI